MYRLSLLTLAALGSAAHATPCDRLAFDAAHLYFTDGTDLFVAPRSGGPSELLVEKAVPLAGACLIADGSRLLYVSGAEVRAVGPAGGTPTVVATAGAPIVDMSFDDGELIVATEREIKVVSGHPRVLARSATGVEAFTTNATGVYWVDSDGSIKSIAKSGGAPITVASGLDGNTDIAVDSDSVYYVAHDALWRARGGHTMRVAKDIGIVTSIDVDARYVYVVADSGLAAVGRTGGRRRLTSDYVDGAVVDGNALVWTSGSTIYHLDRGKPAAIASALARKSSPVTSQLIQPKWLARNQVMPDAIAMSPDGATMFVVNAGDLSNEGPRIDWTLTALPTSGGKGTVIYRDVASELAADATHVYFVRDSAIYELPHAGGTPRLIARAASADDMILGLAVDDGYVYWTEHVAGTVRRVPKHGGVATTLASHLTGPVRIAVDGKHVYWCETPIMRDGDEVTPQQILSRTDKQGGATQVVVRSGSVRELALAGDRIVWLADHGRVMVTNKDGSLPRTLAVLSGAPQSLAVNADGAYVTDSVDGTLRRIGNDGSVTLLHRGRRTWGVIAVGKLVAWSDLGTVAGSGSVALLP